MAAIIAVGLDSTLGFFHASRTAAHPLALDLLELFRTTLGICRWWRPSTVGNGRTNTWP